MEARGDKQFKMAAAHRKPQFLTLVLALIAGFLGGIVSTQFFTGLPAFAEKAHHHPSALISGGLMVVDSSGKLRATLGPSGDGGVVLSMLDEAGVPRLTAKGADNTASLSLWDAEGRLRARLSTPPSSLVFFGEDAKPTWAAP